MKKIYMVLFAAFLAGCSVNVTDETEANDVIETDETVIKSEGSDTWYFEVTMDRPPLYMDQIDSYGIVRILTIEGQDNYFEDTDAYGSAYTYGTCEMIDPYYGSINSGEVYRFFIAGGTIPWENYALSRDGESLQKQIDLAKKNGKELPQNVTQIFTDTMPEEGKVYYAVFSQPETIHGEQTYRIYAGQETFVEVDESTISEESVLGYFPEDDSWYDVKAIWFPEDSDDPRLQKPGKQ